MTCSIKKGVLKNFAKLTGKHLYHSCFFNKVAGWAACNFIKKETLVQVFSCEFWEIFKNTFFTEHLEATASRRNIHKMTSKEQVLLCRSSHWRCSVKKAFRPTTLLKRDPNTDVFLWILRNVSEQLFSRTPPAAACLWKKSVEVKKITSYFSTDISSHWQ